MTVAKMLSPVGRDTAPGGKEARVHPRFRVLLNAQLVTTTDEQSVKLRDISASGALVEGARPIANNKDIVLRRGEIELFARVVWSKGNRCGIEFDGALSDAEMLLFVQQPVKPPSFVPPPFLNRRPSLESEPLTAEQWSIIESWGRPAGRESIGE